MKHFLSITLVMLLTFAAFSQKETIQLNLKVGETYKQNSSAQVLIKQNVGGQSIDIDMTVKAGMAFKVTSVQGNSYLMDASYLSMDMIMKMPQGMSMTFSSSDTDPNNPMSQILGSMVNKSFQIKMSKTGKVEEVTGVEKLFESAFGGQMNPQMAAIKTQLESSFGADAFKGNMEAAMTVYPDKPVKKGDSWSISTLLKSTMEATTTTTYTLSGIDASAYLISGKGQFVSDKTKSMISNNLPMKFDLSGEVISEIKLDKATGWIVEAKIKQSLKGKSMIEDNPQIPGGMEIPMEMNSETIISNQ